ncbi:hypothetical protein ONZ45_g5269 [Pleurotus djamor]|nr:hypothetical protein ONZ45_g5269 [Pleurotus djamor]
MLTPKSHLDVAIFWDYENCHAPSSVSGFDLVKSIRTVAHEYGSVKLFKAYFELTEHAMTSPRQLALRSELQSSGVTLIDCPHNGRKNVADQMMMVDMLTYAIDRSTPLTVILISGDRDFAYAASVLRLRSHEVIIISLSNPGAHPSLKAQASECLDWQADIMGKIEVTESPTSIRQDISGGVSARSTPYRRNLTLDVDTSQPSFSPPKQRVKLAPAPNGRHKRARSASNLPVPFPAYQDKATQVPDSTLPPLTPIIPEVSQLPRYDDVPDDVVSTLLLPSTSASSPTDPQSLANVNIPISVTDVHRKKDSEIVDSQEKHPNATSIMELSSPTHSHKVFSQEASLLVVDQDTSSSVKINLPRPVLDTGITTKPSAQVNLPRPRFTMVGSVNISEPTISSPTMEPPVQSLKSGGDITNGSLQQDVSSISRDPPGGAHRKSLSKLSASSAVFVPAIPGLSQASTAAGNKPTSTSLPSYSKFNPLIAVINSFKEQGVVQPSRSKVAVLLISKFKTAYKDVGVDSFRDYTAMAVKEGVVVMGGREAEAWIDLNGESAFKSEDVAIFWDYENCSISSQVSGYDVVKSIRGVAHRYGSVKLFKAYLEMSEQMAISPKLQGLRSELQCSGVSLTDCPHNGRKNVADQMMIVDMLTYAIDWPAPATILLISGDRDFAYAASALRLRNYNVVVIAHPQGPHPSLRAQATECLDWQSDILETLEGECGAARRHGARGENSSTTNQFQPTVRMPMPQNTVPQGSRVQTGVTSHRPPTSNQDQEFRAPSRVQNRHHSMSNASPDYDEDVPDISPARKPLHYDRTSDPKFQHYEPVRRAGQAVFVGPKPTKPRPRSVPLQHPFTPLLEQEILWFIGKSG